MNDEEFDDLFSGGSPKKKFFEVLRVANMGVVENELENFFLEFAAMHTLLEESEEFEKRLKSAMYSDEARGWLDSLYIRLTADIVSKE
jgi:hypothetical protein